MLLWAERLACMRQVLVSYSLGVCTRHGVVCKACTALTVPDSSLLCVHPNIQKYDAGVGTTVHK